MIGADCKDEEVDLVGASGPIAGRPLDIEEFEDALAGRGASGPIAGRPLNIGVEFGGAPAKPAKSAVLFFCGIMAVFN